MALLCATFNVDLSRRYVTDIGITATGEKLSEEAMAAVAWIRHPTIGELRQQDFDVYKSPGWEIKDNLIFISRRNQPAELALRGDSRVRRIVLFKTPYSGAVELEINGIKKTINLFDKNQSMEVIELPHFLENNGSVARPVAAFARQFAKYLLLFILVCAAMLPIYAKLPAPQSMNAVVIATDQKRIVLQHKYLILLSLATFSLLVFSFYPGIMMLDSYLMYMQALSHEFQDWHSPMMAVLWSFTDKVIRGPGGLFLLHLSIAVYSFYLLSQVALLRGKKFFPLPMIMIFLPMVSILLFVQMTDISMALFFLLAFSLWYFWRGTGKLDKPKLLLIFALVFYGSAVRHTAIAAAVPLVFLFLVDLTTPKKGILLSVALGIFFFLVNQVFVYRILNTFKRHVSQTIMAHDLMGIYAITKENYFPDSYLKKEKLDRLMLSFDHKSLDPTTLIEWKETYISRDLRILEKLRRNWIKAIFNRPAAYLTHRWILFESFLYDADGWTPTTTVSESRPPILRSMPPPLLKETNLGKVHSGYVFWLYRNVQFLFEAFSYVLLSGILLFVSVWWRKRVPGVLAASSLLYVIPYFFFAPAGCYRYTYWSVFATGLALIVLWMEKEPKANPVLSGS